MELEFLHEFNFILTKDPKLKQTHVDCTTYEKPEAVCPLGIEPDQTNITNRVSIIFQLQTVNDTLPISLPSRWLQETLASLVIAMSLLPLPNDTDLELFYGLLSILRKDPKLCQPDASSTALEQQEE